MHNVVINMNTLKVVNYDIKCKPFEFVVAINDISTIKKTIKEKTKNHKTLFGERLYLVEYNASKIQIVESQLNNNISEPIFEYVEVNKEVSLIDSPTRFTLDDIIKAKEEELKNNSYSICELFETDLYKLVDKEFEEHKADIGYKILKIHPNGKIKFKLIQLDSSVTNVYIPIDLDKVGVKYTINGQTEFDDLLNNNLLLDEQIESIELIFSNKTNEFYELNNFYILGR